MNDSLERVEALLRRYGHTYHANLAMAAHQAWKRDPDQALMQLTSEEWWGDSDSVAAVDLAVDGGFSPQARRDAASLREALVDLAQCMADRGVRDPTAGIVAAQLRKWLASGI